MQIFYNSLEVGGTAASYADNTNKPKVNGVELLGNKTTEGLGITWFGTQAEYDALTTIDPNTFYIIDDGSSVITTSNYLDLNNKPSIEGQILTGNKTAGDLNMYSKNEVDNMLLSMRSIKVVSSLPASPVPTTMYYVGPDADGYYKVYLYDSLGNQIDMGTTKQSIYTGKNGIRIDSNSNVTLKNDAQSIIINSEGNVEAATMVGATATLDGIGGITPKPAAGQETYVLTGDGSWTRKPTITYGTTDPTGGVDGDIYVKVSA